MDKEKQYIDEKELWEVVIKVVDMEVRSVVFLPFRFLSFPFNLFFF